MVLEKRVSQRVRNITKCAKAIKKREARKRDCKRIFTSISSAGLCAVGARVVPEGDRVSKKRRMKKSTRGSKRDTRGQCRFAPPNLSTSPPSSSKSSSDQTRCKKSFAGHWQRELGTWATGGAERDVIGRAGWSKTDWHDACLRRRADKEKKEEEKHTSAKFERATNSDDGRRGRRRRREREKGSEK